MNKYPVLFTLFTVLLFGFYTSEIGGQKMDILTHEGRERMYLVHLPKDYNPVQSYPLVIALHGGRGKAKKFNKSTKGRFNVLADKEEFIIVYPQGIDKSWNDNKNRNAYGEARKENVNDVGFIEKMIEKLEATYSIDSTNIFACGISNGGLMSATLATKLQSKIKAIGMVSSNFSEAFIKEMDTLQPQPFSIIIIQGTEDPIFPYNEGDISIFKQKRGRVIGAEKSISFMIDLNGNAEDGIETELPNNILKDNCHSVKIVYPNIENPKLKIELIKIYGGGHIWPGGYQYLPKKLIGRVSKDFNAADELWRFFKRTI